MSLFEYECESCGTRTEKLIRSGEDASSPRCITCSLMMSRVISACAFKGGSGFYNQRLSIPTKPPSTPKE